jgi:hypothetical protein
MALKPVSTESGARDILKRMVAAGRCTIEQLDTPPPGHINPQAYRNLLRDVPPDPKVQVTDPRDFIAEPTETPLPF